MSNDTIYEIEDRLIDIFKFKSEWNSPVKVIQKDMNFMYYKNDTRLVAKGDNKAFTMINCGDWIKVENYKEQFKVIKDDGQFWTEFGILCKRIIDVDFKLFHNSEKGNYLDRFIEEEHGSGVNSLFWFFYVIKTTPHKDIVIDNIDGFLHPISMRQFCIVLKKYFDGYRFIFLMNNDELMCTSIMEIDNLYVMKDSKIKKIQDCTDRELRIAHNLQKLYRAGEFIIK